MTGPPPASASGAADALEAVARQFPVAQGRKPGSRPCRSRGAPRGRACGAHPAPSSRQGVISDAAQPAGRTLTAAWRRSPRRARRRRLWLTDGLSESGFGGVLADDMGPSSARPCRPSLCSRTGVLRRQPEWLGRAPGPYRTAPHYQRNAPRSIRPCSAPLSLATSYRVPSSLTLPCTDSCQRAPMRHNRMPSPPSPSPA